MKVIIIGGVAAGTKVAAKLKRENRDTDVTILTEGKDISYAGCGLPYYVGNVIEHKEELIVNTPEKFEALTGVKVLTQVKVTSVNQKEKKVDAIYHVTGETNSYTYDKLVIASGASPIKPQLDGIDLKDIYFMRTPADAIAVRERIDMGDIKRAVIVGGGFIGLEVAENMAAKGIRVSVIDMASHILPGFSSEFAEYVENHLADHDIMTFTNTKLEGFIGTDKVEKVQTSKRAIKADLVVLSIGIRANTSFLTGTDLELMPNKTIKVNKYMQTNDENIYAVGDCACVTNRVTGEPQWSPMGSTANISGRIAALSMNGKDAVYSGVLGTAICKLPQLNAGRTGLTVEQAKIAGFDPVSVISVVDDKAHYYPDSGNFIVKMIADRDTEKLLGLQVLGKGAVDKMVDIAVTAISMHATLSDLKDMDLAYAPPFSTAIHPFAHTVNILLNKISGAYETIEPAIFAEQGVPEGYQIVDASIVPSISGKPYIDLVKIQGEVEGYPKDSKLLLVCAKGKRAYMVQNRLKYYGYTNTLVLEGGTIFNTIE